MDAERAPGRKGSRGFAFVWTVKRSVLGRLDVEHAADLIEPELEALAGSAADPWSAALGPEGFDGFADLWSVVRGERGAPAEALEMVFEDPLELRADRWGSALAAPRNQPFRMFLSWLRALAEVCGRPTVYVPLSATAELFKVHREQVSRWRSRAVTLGFVELVEPSRPGRAARYRWLAKCDRESGAPSKCDRECSTEV